MDVANDIKWKLNNLWPRLTNVNFYISVLKRSVYTRTSESCFVNYCCTNLSFQWNICPRHGKGNIYLSQKQKNVFLKMC